MNWSSSFRGRDGSFSVMKTRLIGGREVSEIGLGCMNLSHAYGVPPTVDEAKTLVRRAAELGVTLFDTAALYGFGKNEELLGRVLTDIRDRVLITSKCGMTGVDGRRVIDGRPDSLRRTLDDSLRRLRVDVIDLYYLHRCDKAVPIEDSVGTLADMVRAGKIRSIGLSEVSAHTLKRAHAVHPIAALQSEYSLWTRNPEIAVLEECRRLNIAFVAFSPLGRGFLAAGVTDPTRLIAGDLRRTMPRFGEPNWTSNRTVLHEWIALSRQSGSTPAQLALAWVLSRAPHVIPIPGTTSIAHLEENLAASTLQVDTTLATEMERIVNHVTVRGSRYPAATQAEIDAEEFPEDSFN